jgi:hypothetical protein
MELADRDAVFEYIIDTFSMYYDAVDIVQVGRNDAMILSGHDPDPYFNFCIHKDGELSECIARKAD